MLQYWKQHKQAIIIVSLCSLCFFFSSEVFAQWAVDDTASKIVNTAQTLAWLLSRLWIIPARVAGALMTNYFVYGSAFYLDIYLFKFWQILRTFSLYGLWFFFVAKLFWIITHPDEGLSGLGDLVKKVCIGGIAISLSWRAIAALVDLSIVMTAAVGSIPSFIYQEKRNTYKDCFSVPKEVVIEQGKHIDLPLASNQSNQTTIERKDIVAQWDNASWPLMFFGQWVLQLFKVWFLPDTKTNPDGNTEKDVRRSAIAITSITKVLFSLMLIVPMVVLMIVNIIRVVILRLRIVFSPVIILAKVFDINLGEWSSKVLDTAQIIPLILQPVAVVGMLSIGLILMIELTATLKTCDNKIADRYKYEKPAQWSSLTNKDDGSTNANTTMSASLANLWDYVWWVTGEIMLSLFVMFLLRSLIKVWFSFSEITGEYSGKIFDSAEARMGTVPIIPIGWWIGTTAVGQAVESWFGLNRYSSMKSSQQTDRINETLNKFGVGDNYSMKEKDKTKIYDSIQTGEVQTFQKTLQEVAKTKSIPGDYLRRKVIQLLQNKEHKTTISKYLKDTGRTELGNISNEQLEKINEAETQSNLRIPQFINYLMQANPGEKVINTQSSYNNSIESHYGPTEDEQEAWTE